MFPFCSRSSASPGGAAAARVRGWEGRGPLCRLGLIAVTQGNRLSYRGWGRKVTGGWGRGTRGRALLAQRASGGCLVAGLGAGLDPGPAWAWPGLAQAPVPCPRVAATLPSPPRLHLVARCCLQPLAASPGWGDTGVPSPWPCLGLLPQDARLCEHGRVGRPRSLTSKALAGQRACSSVPETQLKRLEAELFVIPKSSDEDVSDGGGRLSPQPHPPQAVLRALRALLGSSGGCPGHC